jgi:PAS domain S-box-containing protein
MKILIVDDNEDVRALYKTVLESSGYEVQTAGNGKEALDQIERQHPDMVVSDIMMPEMDGFQLCRKMKSNDDLKDIPVVLFTVTYTDPDDRKLAMEVGACRYIVKPMDASTFVDTINELIESLKEAGLQPPPSAGKKTEQEIDELQHTVLVNKLHKKIVELEKTNLDLIASRAELQQLATAISQTAESIIITDVDGVIQYVNPGFEKVSGYSKEEAVGQKPSILKSGRHDDTFYAQLWKTISSGKVWSGHFINKRKDGTYYEQNASISPILDSDGKIINYVAVKSDVTENIRLENQLRQAQKMESLGTLAGGIAHDFNNILTIIMGYADMALASQEVGSTAWDDLQEVIKASNRAKELVKQILTFSRYSEQQRGPLQIKVLVKEAVKLLRATIPTSIKFNVDIDPGCGLVLADPNQIQQVIMNLCSNAYHAMRHSGGELTVTLSEIRMDDGGYIGDVAVPAGAYVRLDVRDTGTGIDKNLLDRIFEPYFTTKQKGEGTGLGLAVVHGIVKGHQGYITVDSEPGKGSVFSVFLPRIEDGDVIIEDADNTAAQHIPHGTGKILLVDDEVSVVEVERRMLVKLGYQVTALESSQEALDMFAADPDQFDLVITDMSMPEMTGAELSARMLAIRPDLPVFLCTGFSEEIDEQKAFELGIRKYFLKPPKHDDLARAIRDVLDEKEEKKRQIKKASRI